MEKSNLKENPFVSQPTFEMTSSESMTVPNQALTIREILVKHVRGIAPDIQKNGYYSDSQDFDDIDETADPAFDLVDATESLNQQYANLEAKKKAKADREKELSDKAKAKELADNQGVS